MATAPDLLDPIREQLRARLDELRPLVAEHERLQAAVRALSPKEATATTRGRRGRDRSERSSGRPATRGAGRERVLALVGERPGITRAKLRAASGLSGAAVAQNLRRLRDRGELVESPVPGGQAGYRLARAAGATRRR